MIRYTVRVVSLNKERVFLRTAEEGSFFGAEEGDVFGGYSLNRQKVGRFFDLWLSDPETPHSVDNKNLIRFGRISAMKIEDHEHMFITQHGTFILEAHETVENSRTIH